MIQARFSSATHRIWLSQSEHVSRWRRWWYSALCVTTKKSPKSAKFWSQIPLFLVKGKEAERSQFDFQISNYICKAGTWCVYVGIISLANWAYLLTGSPYICLFHTSSCLSHSDILKIRTTFMDWKGLRELFKTSSSTTISYNSLLEDIKLNLKRF